MILIGSRDKGFWTTPTLDLMHVECPKPPKKSSAEFLPLSFSLAGPWLLHRPHTSPCEMCVNHGYATS